MAVGTAFINVVPEIRGFHRQARKELKSQPLTAQVKLIPEFDRRDARRQVEESKRQIGQVSITMTPDIDAGAARREATATAAGMRRTVPFDIDLHGTGASAEASATAASLRRSVPFVVDLDATRARAQAPIAAASMRQTVTFNVDIDRASLAGAVGAVGSGATSMAASGFRVGSSFARAGLMVAALGPLIVGAVGLASAGIMALPALLGAVAIPIAAIVLGMEGIKAAAASVAPAFAPIKQAVSATFQAVMLPVFQKLTALVPILQAGLVGTAQSLGFMAMAITNVVTSAQGMAWLQQIFAGVNTMIRGMAPAMSILTAAFMQLAAVGIGPLARGLIGAITNFAILFQQMIQQAAATGLLQNAITMFTQILGILLAILPPLLYAGMQMLMIFGPSMMAAFQALIPTIGPLAHFFGLLTAIFFQLFAALWPIVGVIAQMLTPVLWVLLGVIRFLTPALQFLAPVIGALITAYLIWTAVQWALNSALLANPITWVIIAIVALVAAVIWAWQNFAWFRMIVTAAWTGITIAAQWAWSILSIVFNGIWIGIQAVGSFFTWLWLNAVVPAWTGIVTVAGWAGAVLGAIFGGIWIGIQAVGSFFVWLWLNVFVPAWNGIVAVASWAWHVVLLPVFNAMMMVFKIVAAVLFTALVTPFLIAWNLISAAASWAWNVVLRPTFQALAAMFQWLYNNVIRPVAGFIAAAFSVMASTIAAIYHAVIATTWNAMATMARWLYNNVLRPVFDAIGAAWNGLLWFMTAVYNNVLRPTWNALQAAAVFMLNNVLRPVFNAIGAAWSGLMNFFRFLYNTVLQPTWNAIQAAAQFMYNRVLRPVFGAIGAAWNAMGAGIRAIYHRVIVPTFNALKGAVHAVGSAFQSVVGWIGRVWNTIKGILAHPVNFMINVVYNRGIKAAWNKIAGWLKIPGLPNVAPIPTNKRGGIMPGYTPGRDTMMSAVSGGESIMRPEWTRAMGPAWVDTANRVARSQGAAGVRKWVGGANDGPVRKDKQQMAFRKHDGDLLPAFAGGGHTWRRLWGIINKQFPGISLTSNYRPGDSGYHGRGQAIDIGYGDWSRHAGVASWIAGNYPNSTELISAQFRGGLGIKNGRPLNYGAATNAAHRNHVHWAMAGEPVPGKGGGGGVFDILGMVIDWFINTLMKPVTDAGAKIIPKFGENGMAVGMSKIPGKAIEGGVQWIKGLGDRIWDIASNALGALFGGGGGGAGVQRWRGVALQALKMTGQPLGLVDILLRRMQQESGGNPNAINMWDSNAAKGTPSIGLMQTIGPTFHAHKMPGFGNIRAPLDNILASIRYTLATYGSLAAGYNRAGGYDSGGWLPPGMSLTYNGTGRPEAILTAEQWDAMRQATEGNQGGTTINVDAPTYASPERIAAAVDRRLAMSGRI